MAELSTEDLIACGVFNRRDNDDKKPLPENEQRKIIKKIWLCCVAFVFFYAIVCMIALCIK
jgi:hypothetical protein